MSASNAAQTSELVALRTLAQRRRRVVRGILLFLVLTFFLLILSIMNRDQQALDSCRERMEQTAGEFQRVLDARKSPPSELPLPPGADRSHYVYNWFFTESYRPEVGVACCSGPHARFFGATCRMVIILDRGKGEYRAVRMTEEEFAERAADLGFPGGP